MLKIKDSNGSRFLRIITEQFLYSYSHYLKPEDAFDQMYFDPFIFLWDHLTNLWTFIVADPSLPPLKRVEWREMFRHWSHISNCPREDTYFNLNVQTTHDTPHRCSSSSDNEPMAHCSKHERRLIVNASRNGHNVPFRKRRILERALDASYITWDDEHLQLILRQDGPVDGKSRQFYYSEDFDKDGFPIWSGMNIIIFFEDEAYNYLILIRTFAYGLCTSCLIKSEWSFTRSTSSFNGHCSFVPSSTAYSRTRKYRSYSCCSIIRFMDR